MRKIISVFTLLLVTAAGLRAQPFADAIAMPALRSYATNLNGSGIRVAQPEANLGGSFSQFEVSPSTVQQPTNLFTYYSDLGAATGFTNLIGAESGHADTVAGVFYGLASGIATNVAHVDNYDADFYITNYVFNLIPAPPAVIVNQSFSFGSLSVTDQMAVDSAYDDYEETYGTLFVSAVNNGGNVCAPGTSYNCIGVGSYNNGVTSSVGPTIDNGRCKPDIVSINVYTSFTTPQISGAAALLMQAALRGDGGADTNSADDNRTIKALLLNGAVKPSDWTNGPATPLDARYGTGVLNLMNSYEQLAGGENAFCATNLVPLGANHPPTATTNTVASLRGWDLEDITSTATNDAVNEYFFNASNGIFTATITWNRQLGETNINNLNLYLLDAANSNLVACSTSAVDNVQHIYLPRLAAGRYDLQVLKKGGTNVVTDEEVYAFAFEFVSPQLTITGAGTNAVLSWPLYPAGFLVEARTNLISGSWSTNNIPAAFITNAVNYLPLKTTNDSQFFRLRRPNF